MCLGLGSTYGDQSYLGAPQLVVIQGRIITVLIIIIIIIKMIIIIIVIMKR